MKRWSRFLATGYLLALFGASFFTPHQHTNSLADLVDDNPSDSQQFLQADKPAFGGEFALSGYTEVDDDPCLACFWNDFKSVAAIRFAFSFGFTIFAFAFSVQAPKLISTPERLSIIRGPPIASS